MNEEEFAAWKEHPITQWVLSAYAKMAELQQEAWVLSSWEGGEASSDLLIELRTRADAYSSMAECDLSDLVSTHEPEEE